MDGDNIIGLLDEEFEKLMRELRDPNTVETDREKILKRIETISKIRNERVKTDSEIFDSEKKMDEEIRKNDQKTKDDRLNFWLKIGVTIFEVVVPIVAYSIWAYKGFRFEETGTIRSSISKNISSHMKATR